MSRPIGGVLFPGSFRRTGSVTIHLCGLPGINGRAARSLLGLAPDGVYLAARSPWSLVRSYRTVSPLPVRSADRTPSAVCFLWHFPAGRPD